MNAPVSCPCCGHEVQMPFVWDVASGRIATAAGVTDIFNPLETLLLDALIRANGRVVSLSSCIGSMYRPDDEPETVENGVRVHMSRIRRKLRGHDVRIITAHRRGYRIAFGPEAS